MSKDPTIYTDEEMALILRRAGALADAPTAGIGSSEGLTLEQIKAIASEVGIDPALVERAALLGPRCGSDSFLTRVFGGPRRHERVIHLETGLTDEAAARVLSAVRASVDDPGEGRGDSFGVSCRCSVGAKRISVSVVPEGTGTSVRVRIDRTPAVVQTVFWTQFAVVMPIWMLIESVNSYGDLALLGLVPAGVLASARAFWAASTRAVRDQARALSAAMIEAIEDSHAVPPEG